METKTKTETEKLIAARGASRASRAAYGKLNAYVQACRTRQHHFHERWKKKLEEVQENLRSTTKQKAASKEAKLLKQQRDLAEKLTRPPILRSRRKFEAARVAFLGALQELHELGLSNEDLVGAGVPASDLEA